MPIQAGSLVGAMTKFLQLARFLQVIQRSGFHFLIVTKLAGAILVTCVKELTDDR